MRSGRVGRGLMGVWPESTGPESPAWALDRLDTPNFSLTKGCPLAHLPNLQEEGAGPHLCVPTSALLFLWRPACRAWASGQAWGGGQLWGL